MKISFAVLVIVVLVALVLGARQLMADMQHTGTQNPYTTIAVSISGGSGGSTTAPTTAPTIWG